MSESQPPFSPPSPAPLPVPPSAAAPAGRPRIWQAAAMFLAFGLLAGGSCAGFLTKPNGPGAEALSILFFLSVPFAAAAFSLLVFRLWRRRNVEHWPSLLQCVLIGLAGAVLAAGGCGAWAVTMDAPGLVPISIPFGALFVVGVAFAIGAVELFAIGVVRLILKRPGAQ
jgi:hypothetical protein